MGTGGRPTFQGREAGQRDRLRGHFCPRVPAHPTPAGATLGSGIFWALLSPLGCLSRGSLTPPLLCGRLSLAHGGPARALQAQGCQPTPVTGPGSFGINPFTEAHSRGHQAASCTCLSPRKPCFTPRKPGPVGVVAASPSLSSSHLRICPVTGPDPLCCGLGGSESPRSESSTRPLPLGLHHLSLTPIPVLST